MSCCYRKNILSKCLLNLNKNMMPYLDSQMSRVHALSACTVATSTFSEAHPTAQEAYHYSLYLSQKPVYQYERHLAHKSRQHFHQRADIDFSVPVRYLAVSPASSKTKGRKGVGQNDIFIETLFLGFQMSRIGCKKPVGLGTST